MPEMTLEEKVREKLAEERRDVVSYTNLAKEADAKGCHRLAKFLLVIADEERTHANFFDEYLKGYNDWEK